MNPPCACSASADYSPLRTAPITRSGVSRKRDYCIPLVYASGSGIISAKREDPAEIGMVGQSASAIIREQAAVISAIALRLAPNSHDDSHWRKSVCNQVAAEVGEVATKKGFMQLMGNHHAQQSCSVYGGLYPAALNGSVTPNINLDLLSPIH